MTYRSTASDMFSRKLLISLPNSLSTAPSTWGYVQQHEKHLGLKSAAVTGTHEFDNRIPECTHEAFHSNRRHFGTL